MINKLVNYLKDKKILILGFGLEGISTYKFIRKYLKEQILYISDFEKKFNEKYDFLSEDKNLVIIAGEEYLDNLEQYDIIMKTPGISFANIDTSKFEQKIKSQIELFLEFVNVFSIGVTGTKGKSTTSSLITKVLQEQGKDAILLGNIGIPLFDCFDMINMNTIVVLEMSSHQLEYVKVSPKIAILLNIYEEHLDHYKSMQGYVDAKMKIAKFQKESDYFIYNIDNETTKKELSMEYKAKKIEISCKNDANNCGNLRVFLQDNLVKMVDKQLYDINNERKLIGEHNVNNIMFVLAVSEILKLDLNKTVETINTFESLPHRMEFVGKYNDILFYNNSIATVPEATIPAVKALKVVDTLIIGGMDRGIDFSEFIDFLNNSDISNLICMPTTGHYIADKIKNKNMNVFKVKDMKEAIEIAKQKTAHNKVCLLSPTSASYGVYKNFREKGEEFKKFVKEY